MNFLRILQHLLPRAEAWRLPVELETEYSVTCNADNQYTCGRGSTCGQTRFLKDVYGAQTQKFHYKFFKGLTGFLGPIKDEIDLTFLDLLPENTRELTKWEEQFNLVNTGSETERRQRLSSAWKARGGQGLDYLQELIHEAGFTSVYIHQWWTDTSSGYTTKNPFSYIDAPNNPLPGGGYLLVNKGPTIAQRDYPVYLESPDSDCGSLESECGDIEGFSFLPVEYDLPADVSLWPYFIYLAAENFPNHAFLDVDRKDEFERLLLTYFPAQHWLGLLINYS